MKNTRRGLGKGLGTGYKNLAPMDSHIHSLSAKGVKSVTYSPFNYPKKGKDNGLYFVMSAETGDMKEIVVGKTNAEKKVKEWAKKTKQEMILAQQKGTAGLYAKGNVKFPIIIMNKDYDITIGESGEAQPQGIIIDVSSNDQDRDDPILDTYTIWYDDFDWDKEKALKFAKKKLVEDGYTLNAKIDWDKIKGGTSPDMWGNEKKGGFIFVSKLQYPEGENKYRFGGANRRGYFKETYTKTKADALKLADEYMEMH